MWEGARCRQMLRKHSELDSSWLPPSSLTCLRAHVCGHKVLLTELRLVPWPWWRLREVLKKLGCRCRGEEQMLSG